MSNYGRFLSQRLDEINATRTDKTICPVCGHHMVYIGQGSKRMCGGCGFKGQAISSEEWKNKK